MRKHGSGWVLLLLASLVLDPGAGFAVGDCSPRSCLLPSGAGLSLEPLLPAPEGGSCPCQGDGSPCDLTGCHPEEDPGLRGGAAPSLSLGAAVPVPVAEDRAPSAPEPLLSSLRPPSVPLFLDHCALLR